MDGTHKAGFCKIKNPNIIINGQSRRNSITYKGTPHRNTKENQNKVRDTKRLMVPSLYLFLKLYIFPSYVEIE